MAEQKNRNRYIDLAKFFMALCIVLFHTGGPILPGGRIAVEGFFMISGYFLMRSLRRALPEKTSPLRSTARYVQNKYLGLLPFLIPSVVLGFLVYSRVYAWGIKAVLRKLPTVMFGIVPLQCTGLPINYYLGIDWYLSVMFFSHAIVYFCMQCFGVRAMKRAFLFLCPVVYGFLCVQYGSLAVPTDFLGGLVNAQLLRGLAGTATGCLLFDTAERLQNCRLTKWAARGIAAAEIFAYPALLAEMQLLAKTRWDYATILLWFGVLAVGISGRSPLHAMVKTVPTKVFGLASTLLVLNHYCWGELLRQRLGYSFSSGLQLVYYFLCISVSCMSVYFSGKAIQKSLKNRPEKG